MAIIVSKFLERVRVSAALPYIEGSVLDLGCGYGAVLSRLTPKAYVGIDGEPAVLRWLKKTYPNHTFIQRDLDTDPLGLDQTFDTVVMLAVIEHLKQPENILRQISTYLKPGGKLVVTTPSPIGDQIHQIGARVGLFSKVAMEDHETIFNQQTLTTMFTKFQFQPVVFRRFLLGGNQLFVFKR